jgi:hypothetical protein
MENTKTEHNWGDERISRIIKLELIITEALSKGHKASEDDEYQKFRIELKQLREQLGLKRRAQ